MAKFSLRRFDINSMADPAFKKYPNGWYFGELVRDRRHGQGMFFWPGGKVYMGGWVNDLRSGFGIYRDGYGGLNIGNWNKRFMTGWGVSFDKVGPTISFPLPEDEELRDAMGEHVEEHRDFIMDNDYEFGDVIEGVFRGSRPGGYCTIYRRSMETGVVWSWSVGGHNKDENLDGYGVKHEGTHPLFQNMEDDEIEKIISMQGEWIDGDLIQGPATQTISYWLRGAAIQVIQINGTVNADGLFEQFANVSLDGQTLWSGRVYTDPDRSESEQYMDIIDEHALDTINIQRQNTVKAILEDGIAPEKYDTSSIIPNIADTTPESVWVLDLMKSHSDTAIEIKEARQAELDRLFAAGLKYTNRFFVTDYEDDVVAKHDGARVAGGNLILDFDLTFNPEFSTRLDTDEEGNPITTVHIMCGNKIVGDFAYNNAKMRLNLKEVEIVDGLNYDEKGMSLRIPISDGNGEFEHRLWVEQEHYSYDDDPNNVLTRAETIPLEGSDEDEYEDDGPNMETMDVERDEDGNITGIGSSDEKNIGTILNLFKQGAHFVPIDEILEKAKRTK